MQELTFDEIEEVDGGLVVLLLLLVDTAIYSSLFASYMNSL